MRAMMFLLLLAGPALAQPAAPEAAARLRTALAEEVPRTATLEDGTTEKLVEAARKAWQQAGMTLDRPQLLVVVDRNPAVQRLALVLAHPDGEWEGLGSERVSTGRAGRRGYFITPTGIFLHTTAIRDYRAEGTFNENGIRGLGVKGSRVWDFGWTRAQPGWLPPEEPPREMRLLLHATDPDQLEQRLGRTDSMGCVRISGALNRFLDRYGVLDVEHEQAAQSGDARFQGLLLPDRAPTPLAGRAMVVVDSSLAQ